MAVDPSAAWQQVKQAAQAVARDVGLKEDWLNTEYQMYAWQMPLGWRARCNELGRFGPLTVMALSRRDLIASKAMGAPLRIQDRSDLESLQPDADELDFVDQHLRRIESETEPGHCDAQRRLVISLREAP